MITKLILSINAAFNGFLQSIINATWLEWLFLTIGGAIGWLIGRFEPALTMDCKNPLSAALIDSMSFVIIVFVFMFLLQR